jgi:hypothetical protein
MVSLLWPSAIKPSSDKPLRALDSDLSKGLASPDAVISSEAGGFTLASFRPRSLWCAAGGDEIAAMVLWARGDAAEEQSRGFRPCPCRRPKRGRTRCRLAVFAREFTRLKRLGLLYLFSRITVRKLLKELSQATP